MIKAKQLKNGLRYHLIPFDGTQAVTVLVLANVGSRYETDKVWGGSHFIEHMMFKGTKKRPTTLDISKELDRYGAQFNAYTGKDLTGYYVKIASDKTEVAIDLLHDMLFNSKFDQKELAREKKVIAEEIKMYEENPIMHIGDLVEEVMFAGTKLGREIAGNAESVLKMKRSDILSYRDLYYQPSQMVVVVAGAVPKNAVQMLQKTFGSVSKQVVNPGVHERVSETSSQSQIRIKRDDKNLKQIQVALGFPAVGRGHKDLPAIKILSSVLGGSMSSRLFIEVRERRGLCYSIHSRVGTYEDVGTFTIFAGLDSGRLAEAMKTMFKEIEKIKKYGITAKELQYTKEHVEGAMKLNLEDSSSQAEFYAKQELFLGEAKTPQERLAELQAIKRSDVQRVAMEVLDFSKASIAVIGPYKTDEQFLAHIPKFK
ncbi:insulinase family protein [Patescibacteria group bacterium]|nr:insulinase family protein [Patescibacteria group bacterium]